MNCSQTPLPASSSETKVYLTEYLRLEVKAPIPSLNRVIEKDPKERYRHRWGIQESISFALKAVVDASRTKTTSAPSTILMHYDTLQSFRMTRQTRSNYKSRRRRWIVPKKK